LGLCTTIMLSNTRKDLKEQKRQAIINNHINEVQKMDEGYCVKCKAKSGMKDTKVETTKNGRNMMKGICVKCGTKMCRILPK